MRSAAPVTQVLFAIPILLPRAVAIWALIRLAVAMLPLGIGAPVGSISPSSPIVALVCGAVGLVDIRVRRERILWANLGVAAVLIFVVYAATGAVMEALGALVLR